MTLLEVATRASERWTELYTRGLEEDQRSARQAEIRSDVWEHIHFDVDARIKNADTGFEILMRTVLGIPADLMWRRSTSRLRKRTASLRANGERTMTERSVGVAATVFTVAVGLFLIVGSVGVMLDGSAEDIWWVIPAELISGILIVTGVVLMSYNPRVATTMTIVGAVLAASMHYWMALLGVPVAVAIILGSLSRSRSVLSRRPIG